MTLQAAETLPLPRTLRTRCIAGELVTLLVTARAARCAHAPERLRRRSSIPPQPRRRQLSRNCVYNLWGTPSTCRLFQNGFDGGLNVSCTHAVLRRGETSTQNGIPSARQRAKENPQVDPRERTSRHLETYRQLPLIRTGQKVLVHEVFAVQRRQPQ